MVSYYLSSYLKSRFKDIEILYLEQQLTFNQHLERVKEYKPDLYGLSFASLLVDDAMATIQRIKKIYPDLIVICGGPHPSAMPQEVAAIPGVTACVIGEGEETVADLVRHFLFHQRKLDQIPGTAFLKDGKVTVTPKRSLISDLDTIPLPDWI